MEGLLSTGPTPSSFYKIKQEQQALVKHYFSELEPIMSDHKNWNQLKQSSTIYNELQNIFKRHNPVLCFRILMK